MGSGRSHIKVAVVLVLALLVSACTSGEADFGAWLDDAPRTVRLVVDDSPLPETRYYVMETHYAAGAAAGAGAGGGAWLEGGSGCSGDASGVCLLIWLVLLPVMILGGAAVGAATADPTVADSWPLADVESTRPLAAEIAEVAPPIRGRAGDTLAQLIRDNGEHTVIIVPASEASAAASPPGQPDATVSLDLLGIGLRGDAGEDPSAGFQLEFTVKVVWNAGIKDDVFRFDSRRARLSEWPAEDFRPVREAIYGMENEFIRAISKEWFRQPSGSEEPGRR